MLKKEIMKSMLSERNSTTCTFKHCFQSRHLSFKQYIGQKTKQSDMILTSQTNAHLDNAFKVDTCPLSSALVKDKKL